jgi:hypothetical protein
VPPPTLYALAVRQPIYRIRRSVAKTVLDGVERLADEARHEVLSQVPDAVVHAIRDGLALGWMDADDYHRLVGPLFETLGADAFRSFFTERYIKFAEHPTLAAITHTALRLGSATPLGLAKFAPAAWRHLTTGLGQLEFAAAGDPPRLQYLDYPQSSAPAGMFAYLLAGAFDGFYPLCDRRGRIELVELDIARGNATFLFRDATP